jgi:hypothetical protein
VEIHKSIYVESFFWTSPHKYMGKCAWGLFGAALRVLPGTASQNMERKKRFGGLVQSTHIQNGVFVQGEKGG